MIVKEVPLGIDRNQAVPIATIAQDAGRPPSVGAGVQAVTGLIARRDFTLFMPNTRKYRAKSRGDWRLSFPQIRCRSQKASRRAGVLPR